MQLTGYFSHLEMVSCWTYRHKSVVSFFMLPDGLYTSNLSITTRCSIHSFAAASPTTECLLRGFRTDRILVSFLRMVV